MPPTQSLQIRSLPTLFAAAVFAEKQRDRYANRNRDFRGRPVFHPGDSRVDKVFLHYTGKLASNAFVFWRNAKFLSIRRTSLRECKRLIPQQAVKDATGCEHVVCRSSSVADRSPNSSICWTARSEAFDNTFGLGRGVGWVPASPSSTRRRMASGRLMVSPVFRIHASSADRAEG